MPPQFIDTNSFQGVGAGQKATLELPVGAVKYHAIQLNYGTATAGGPTRANMEAELTEIQIKLNGKAQRTFSAKQLFDINAVNGITVNDGFLWIWFSEPWQRSAQGEDTLGWGTADIATFTIEATIDGGATNPTLEARLLVDEIAEVMGPIVKWRRHNVNVSATGLRNVTNLPKIDAYYALHAFSTNINSIEVTIDQKEIWAAQDAQMRELYTQFGLSVPAALTSVLFDFRQRVADALPMGTRVATAEGEFVQPVADFRIDFDMSAATGFDLVTETLGPRD